MSECEWRHTHAHTHTHTHTHTPRGSLFDDVLRANKDLLATFGFVGLVTWVLFSVLMYFTERYNVNLEVRVRALGLLSGTQPQPAAVC